MSQSPAHTRAAQAHNGAQVTEAANALTVTPEALDDFFACFELPADDEDALIYTGDLDAVFAAVTRR